MKGIWAEGLVIGFISKHNAEQKLMEREPGCFLLRYSDSVPSEVMIGFKSINCVKWSGKDFTKKGLDEPRICPATGCRNTVARFVLRHTELQSLCPMDHHDSSISKTVFEKHAGIFNTESDSGYQIQYDCFELPQFKNNSRMLEKQFEEINLCEQ